MQNIRPTGAVGAVLPLFLLGLCSGCMSMRVTRVARFEPGRSAGAVHRPAPQSAAYKVKYAGASGRELRTVGGTKRIVRRGDGLGFAISAEGTLVALAGDEQILLDRLPPSARYCVWTFKEKRPTQFSREIGKAAITAVAVPVVGAIVLGTAYLDHPEEKCDEEEAADDPRKDAWELKHIRNDKWDPAHDRRESPAPFRPRAGH